MQYSPQPLQTNLFPSPRPRGTRSTTAASCAGWRCGKRLSLDSRRNHAERAYSEESPIRPGQPVRYYCRPCTMALYEGRGTIDVWGLIDLALASLMAIVVTLLH